jgi:hypothetical protein
MDEHFSPQQSLQLIQSMIGKTRDNLSENRIYFLLWGWVTFLAILLQFFLKVIVRYEHHYLVWLCVLPTAIYTYYYSARRRGQSNVRTYVGDGMSYLWSGIGISFFILSLIVSKSNGGWLNAWPLFILFYGLGTFISGRMLQFRPLVIGGIINWLLSVLCIFIPYDYQLLAAAAAILTSYIIPGHLLRTKDH